MQRIGIIGCGSIARTHIWAIKQLEHAKIVALADTDIQKASSLREECLEEKVKVYQDYQEMISLEGLDSVHICTPHHLHVPMAIEALSKGIAVFMEKPPAISMAQFERLQNIARSSSAKLGFCFQNRYNQSTLAADEIIKSGRLGKVVGARAFVTWRRDENYYESEWKGKLETEGGGALINQSIHTLDLLLRYFDEPTKVQASLLNHHLKGKVEVEDTVEAFMAFSHGERACFYATTAYVTDAPNILEFEGEKGSLAIIDSMVTVKEKGKEISYIPCKEKQGIGKSYWGSGHLSCIKDFYQKLLNGEPFQNDIAGVEKTMKTMMRIYEFR